MIPALLALLLGALQDDARALVEKLRSDSIEERESAVARLKALGTAALPELEKAAKSTDAEVASRARFLVRRLELRDALPPRLVSAIPGVEDRLASGDARAWTRTLLEAAARFEEKPNDAALRPEDLDPLADGAVRGAADAAEKLRVCEVVDEHRLISAVAGLRQLALRDTDSGTRQQAVRALGWMGAREAIPDLAKLIDDSSREVRAAAFHALSFLDAREAIPTIRERLVRGSYGEQGRAAAALGWMEAREAVPDLLGLLSKADVDSRHAVVEALGRMGAAEAIPALVPVLMDRDWFMRSQAAESLGKLGATSQTPAVARLLKDENSHVRLAAAIALGSLGARDRIGELAALLEDPVKETRLGAAIALCALGAREHAAAIAAMLQGGDGTDRAFLTSSLAALGAKEAVPAIEKVLVGPEEIHRVTAASALCRLGSRAGVPLLMEGSKYVSGRKLLALNALRRPQAWKELCERKPSARLRGTRRELLGRVAEWAGMKLEGPSTPSHLDESWLSDSRRVPMFMDSATLADEFAYLLWATPYSLILEPGRAVLVRSPESLKFWRDWWEEEKKK